MTAQGRGLGKGLEALISSEGIPEGIKNSIVELKINDITPNSEQPRKRFDRERLDELTESIRITGVIQPIIVRREGRGYRIVAGERRWRAARQAGLAVIPAIVREMTDAQVLEVALIENIQRQDLNPIEEALAFDRLIREHGLTQERLSSTIGLSRPAIANTLRLLNLSEEIRQYVVDEKLSAGHARALLALPAAAVQRQAADVIVDKGLSVRETEKLVRHLLQPRKKPIRPDEAYRTSVKAVEERLGSALGTRVHLKDRNRKGTIVIEYYSYEDLSRLLDLIAGKDPESRPADPPAGPAEN